MPDIRFGRTAPAKMKPSPDTGIGNTDHDAASAARFRRVSALFFG
jgi:hypothetical protein